jgi:hypothetical protein
MSDPARAHLLETWQSCQQAVTWLRRSFDKSPLPPYEEVSADDWDQLEALSGRFARLTDLIVHKLFRALDRYECEETGSLLDAANRAVKRGLIESTSELRDIKDIRNEIVYEYAIDDLSGLYADIHRATPRLLFLVERIEVYLEQTHGFAPKGIIKT